MAVLRLAILAAGLVSPVAAWAQAAEASAAASKAADSLLDKGVLGTVCVVFMLAAGLLGWRYSALWDARLADAKAATADVRASNAELVEVNKASAEALRVNAEKMAQLAVSVDSASRGADERWRTLGELLAALTPIQNGIAANGSALGRIEADTREMTKQNGRGGGR